MTGIQVPRPPRPEGYHCGTLLATFVHLHLATDPSLAGRFVVSCARYPKKSSSGNRVGAWKDVGGSQGSPLLCKEGVGR